MDKDIFGYHIYIDDEVAFIDKHEKKMRKGKVVDVSNGNIKILSFDTHFKEHYFTVKSKETAKKHIKGI